MIALRRLGWRSLFAKVHTQVPSLSLLLVNSLYPSLERFYARDRRYKLIVFMHINKYYKYLQSKISTFAWWWWHCHKFAQSDWCIVYIYVSVTGSVKTRLNYRYITNHPYRHRRTITRQQKKRMRDGGHLNDDNMLTVGGASSEAELCPSQRRTGRPTVSYMKCT